MITLGCASLNADCVRCWLNCRGARNRKFIMPADSEEIQAAIDRRLRCAARMQGKFLFERTYYQELCHELPH